MRWRDEALRRGTTMNLFDVGALAALVLAVALGAWVGFFPQLLGLVGAAVGFAIALVGASTFHAILETLEQPMRAFVAASSLITLTLLGEAAGSAIGSRIRFAMRERLLGTFDAGGGMLVGLGQGVLAIWIVGGLILAGAAPTLERAAATSLVLRSINGVLPAPEGVAQQVTDLLAPTEFPKLFAGIEPSPAPPLELPGTEAVRAIAESGEASTVQVIARGCGREQLGTGFFVSSHVVVTNAHVVAGGETVSVQQASESFRATLVLYDPEQDVALLRVPSATRQALRLASATPPRGTRAAALGHPLGGPLTIIPAVVTTSFDARGPDIYDRTLVSRTIVEVRAQVRRGDSGGPLMTGMGVAGGIVFGASRVDPGVGYAISAASVATELRDGEGRTAAVGSGACTSG
jgi:S1-C subfamily serine protease